MAPVLAAILHTLLILSGSSFSSLIYPSQPSSVQVKQKDVSPTNDRDNPRSSTYGYDLLDRLTATNVGALSSGAIASPTRTESWAMDTLGNWCGPNPPPTGTTPIAGRTVH